MKKGFSLIEIIVTIIIISITMVTIPKIFKIVNKTFLFTQKQEAIYNAVSISGHVIKLAWDENNYAGTGSLVIDSGDLALIECRGLRRAGDFENGSRECNTTQGASFTGGESSSDDKNDLDDYKDYNITVNSKYIIRNVFQYRTADADFLVYSGNSAVIDLNKTTYHDQRKNTKMLTTNIEYAPGYKNLGGKQITSFSYMSPNIGLAIIESL